MIRAVIEGGVIKPIEPLPHEWSEGRIVGVDLISGDETLSDVALDNWMRRLNALGSALYEPGEADELQRYLDEADIEAKAYVRNEMGLI
jgi:predicted DNA-binding antitoxin AbrB/MazE fold protein